MALCRLFIQQMSTYPKLCLHRRSYQFTYRHGIHQELMPFGRISEAVRKFSSKRPICSQINSLLVELKGTFGKGNRSNYRKSFSTSLRKSNNLKNEGNKSTAKRALPKVSSSEIRRLIGLLKPERWNLTGALLCLLLSSGVSMSVPFFIGKIIDIIYSQSSSGENMITHLQTICLSLIVVFLIGGLANFGRVYLLQTSSQRIVKRLRELLFGKIMRQELGFFDKTKTGELLNRLSADTSLVAQSLSQNVSDGLRAMFQASAGIGMMAYVSSKLTLISMGIVPPVAIASIVYGRYLRKITRKVQDSLADATTVAEERISNIRTVKAFAHENIECERYKLGLQRVLDLSYQEALARAVFWGFTRYVTPSNKDRGSKDKGHLEQYRVNVEQFHHQAPGVMTYNTGFSGNIIIISVLYFGGFMMMETSISVGDLSSFLLYAAYVGASLGGLTSFYTELNRGVAASSRIWELIDRQPNLVEQSSSGLSKVEGNFRFDKVFFAYPSRDDFQIFSDLSMEIPASQITALVGPSGSGKSTIGSLMLRFYDPNSGTLYLDGNDIRDLDSSFLRSQIGVVSQDPVLFSASIFQNIAYGAPSPSMVLEEDVLNAAVKANAHTFIKEFPSGMDTLVGQRGQMLSGGQRQRIAIARAIVKNPKVLILDEATSALDAESEYLVQDALEQLMIGRTVLIIAHRLSTIMNADNILVIDKGKLVEHGTYEELMTMEGLFRKLVDRQTLSR